MWIILAIASALCLGFYDIFKKLSVKSNNVLIVLLWSTFFGALLMSPEIITGISHGNWGFGNTLTGHLLILVKSFIVLGSWLLGYTAIKHLPLTVQGPINATRPVLVLVGAVLIFGEYLTILQWIGILLGFVSLFMISRIGAREGVSMHHSRWIWMAVGATVLGSVSALYDKYLYFDSLSFDTSSIATVSMIRRGSVLVSFLYGAFVLHEKDLKQKAIDLGLLFISLILLIIGANLNTN